MNKPLTLGSLFDGSGGFPLAGLLTGIVPVWSSEIEPFAIRVTEKRLPQVQHFGNISGLHGAKLPPVDIITFGSPCQDMSIAGKRTGLNGSRSSLFHEAIRIIQEMRCASNGKYPRYIVWENVPGAFSSNGGEDFRCVLEAICSVKDSSISIPRPAGKWTKAGEILAESYSLAWRVLDAQYWGVPQRRKRIFLVADFDGRRAGKILFESEGLSGYSAESLRAWQRTAGSAADGFGTAGLCLCDQGGERIDILKERTATLRAEAHHPPCVLENHPADSRLQISENGKVQTLTSRCGTGGGNVPLLMDTPKTLKIRCGKAGGGKGSLIQENKSATLSCNNDQTVFQPKAYGISSFSSNAMLSGNPHSGIYEADTARTLDTSDQSPSKNQGGIAVLESYALQGSMIGRSDQNGPQGGGVNKEVAFTLNATDHHAVYAASTGNFSSAFRETTPTLLARDHKDPSIVSSGYAVRRLTPQECARLQGFPDQWCSDLASENPTEEEIDRWAAIFEEYRKVAKPDSRSKSRKMVQKWLQDPYRDAAEYRLWGNGICLNVAVFVLAGIVWADL
ncbi:DNA cytosine methyltransferase [Ruminococcus callidus]|uniref:DNA cytosine methyltransferase n=1 Tax=Ruminococcus callidus TaxID=40519 RepID=UPI00266ED1DB|nr:DNA cytosine methyltransferase [uncultured Ruminococcus sp.]